MNRKTFLKLFGLGAVAAPAVVKAAAETDFSHWNSDFPVGWSSGVTSPSIPTGEQALYLFMRPGIDPFSDEYEFTIELANGETIHPHAVNQIAREGGAGIDFEVFFPDGRVARIEAYPPRRRR